MLVDITIEQLSSKTSVRQPAFLKLLQFKLEQCLTGFHMHCLRKMQDLLTDQDMCIGLFNPAIFSTLEHKVIIEMMIGWNDTIGFPFLHTYSPDGNVVSVDFNHLYFSLTTIFVIRLLGGLTTFSI